MYTKKFFTYQDIHLDMCKLICEYLDWHAKLLKDNPNAFAHKAKYLAKTLSYLQKKQMGTEIRILDLGCSVGDILMTLKHFGFSNLYGVNLFPLENEFVHGDGKGVSEDQRFQKLKASFFNGEDGIRFYQLDMEAEKIPVDDASMNLIISFDVLEHLHFPLVFLKEVKRCLVPSGTFICATPNQSTLRNRIRALFGRSIYIL